MKKLIYTAYAAALLSFVLPFGGYIELEASTFKEDPSEEKGLRIALEADSRDSGFGNNVVDLKMTLRNRHGEESIRYITSKTLEVKDDGDKFLAIFSEPKDIRGTVVLTHSHKTGSDDQWIYLPALKRVKRIASNNKSGPFMGSEFAYEDISSQEVEKYTYKYLRDDTVGGIEYFVVERYPVDKKSGYSKQIVWIDKSEYRNKKIEFYDRKGDLQKTLTYNNYKQYLGKFWRAEEMFMENHQTGKSTLLSWEEYKFQTDLSERDFNRHSLKRVK